jgi:hypothetical protein
VEIYIEAESDIKIQDVKRGESRIRPEDLRVLQLENSTDPFQEGQRVVFQVTISNGSRHFGEPFKQFSHSQG